MDRVVFKLVVTSEAKEFLEVLSPAIVDKITYNIDRVARGEKNNELFKKLENTEIWEFRTIYNKTAYRLQKNC